VHEATDRPASVTLCLGRHCRDILIRLVVVMRVMANDDQACAGILEAEIVL